jgi:linoleoyl-CoA desaturase
MNYSKLELNVMEIAPSYTKLESDQHLYVELKRKVYEKINGLDKKRLKWTKAKAIILPVTYFALYIVALQQAEHPSLYYALYACMGITMVFIFLNIIHEASHNVLFRNKKLNGLFLRFFDILGANSYIWKLRHTRLHHNFSNVAGWDSDVQQSGLFKVFPSDETKKIHHYQHILLFILYPVYLVNWLLIRDFKDFFSKKQLIRKVCRIPFIEYAKLFFFKSLFFFYSVIVPGLFFGCSFSESVMALFIMLITAGIFALIVLLPPHANVENDFPVAHCGKLPNSWLLHQLITTNDVSTSNWFTKFLMCNFNYHVSHHLFPNISSAYAPEVTAIIEEYAACCDLPYKKYPLFMALKNHYLLIKKNGIDTDFFEHEM